MKYPSPEQHWNEWGYKLEYSRSIGNFESYWLKFLRINKKWWFMMKMKNPCKKCDKRDECPADYLCDEFLEWAYLEDREV